MRNTAWISAVLAVMCGACADLAMPATAPQPVSPVSVLIDGGNPNPGGRVTSGLAARRSDRIVICRLGGTNAIPAMFVIDGRLVGKDELARLNLNPADIDRIEIMKGPAAVARYGGPATDGGVVIVTTRAGRAP